jgi:hypothetical protein
VTDRQAALIDKIAVFAEQPIVEFRTPWTSQRETGGTRH